MENLYEFYWDCGRQGVVRGRFLATKEVLDKMIGKEVYFGEILGKHSDIYGTLEECDITLITDNQEFLQKAKELKVNLESGYNPLDYIEEE